MTMRTRLKKHSLKFLSLFLSLFLWAYVLNSEKISFEKTVYLDYILPEDMIFSQRPVQEVTFLLQGPRAFVRSVTEREDRMVIDLIRANPKRQLFFQIEVIPTQLNLPFGMIVEKVIPRKISIRLEKKSSKIVPLKFEIIGDLPDSLSLVKPQLIPEELEVYGPRSVVNDLKFLPTRAIEFDQLIGKEMAELEVALPDERLTLPSSASIKLRYQIKAASPNLTLKEVPIKFLTKNRRVDTKTKTAILKLLVPESVTKNRSNISSSVQVWADIPEGSKGTIEVPLKVVLPPSIHLLEVIPKSIIVNIQ